MPKGIYKRGKINGSRKNPILLFEKHIELIPFTDCWIWNGWLDKDGYGRFQNPIYKNENRASRLSYLLYKGAIPKGLCVCHICDNPSCVNPNHLWLGTQGENARDRQKKGRGRKGIILTNEQVLEIRSKYIPYAYSAPKLALEYGVSNATIQHILERRIYKDI